MLLLLLASCNARSSYEVQDPKEDGYYEVVDVGSFTTSSALRSLGSAEVKNLTFYSDNGDKGMNLDVYIYKDENLFGYDADRDGAIDFYSKLNGEKFDEFVYLDTNKNELKEFSVSFLNENEVQIKPVSRSGFTSDENLRGIFGGKESLGDCFKRRMSTTHGIVMTCASSLIGPEGPLAICAAAALSCSLWTPN